MKRLLAILLLATAAISVHSAQIWTVNTVPDLQWLNANTINTNVFVVNGLAQGDGLGGMWSFFRNDFTATNTVAAGGPVESVNPVSPPGRWFKLIGAATIDPGGTNVFNTIIVTNVLFANYIIVTNLYMTTNTFVINNGGTNDAGLWIVDGASVLRPVDIANYPYRLYQNGQFEIDTTNNLVHTYGDFDPLNGAIQLWSVGGTNLSKFNVSASVVEMGGNQAILNFETTNTPPLMSSTFQVDLYNSTGYPYRFGTAVSIADGSPFVDFYNFNTNILSITASGGLEFGPGTTNVLYRSGSDLVYTNGSTDPKFIVLNGSADGVELEAQGATGFLTAAGTSTTVGLRASTSQVILTGGVFSPVVDLHESLGQLGNSFNNTYTSNLWVRGHYSAATNYALLNVRHTGTNGAVVLDSLTSGTDGAPRLFTFSFNGATTNSIDIGPSPAATPYGFSRDVNGEPVVTVSATGVLRASASGPRIPDGSAFYWAAGDVSTAAIRNGIYNGTGTPEGALAATVGSFYLDYTGGGVYCKTNGVGNTGWGKLKFE